MKSSQFHELRTKTGRRIVLIFGEIKSLCAYHVDIFWFFSDIFPQTAKLETLWLEI